MIRMSYNKSIKIDAVYQINSDVDDSLASYHSIATMKQYFPVAENH